MEESEGSTSLKRHMPRIVLRGMASATWVHEKIKYRQVSGLRAMLRTMPLEEHILIKDGHTKTHIRHGPEICHDIRMCHTCMASG